MTAPTITGLITSVTFGENTVNAAPQIIDGAVTVTDAEGNFNGGALTVSGHFGGDSVSIRDQGTGAGQIGFSGGTITYGGTVIGTATGGEAGAKFVVTFNANATTAGVEALIENLTYANSNNVNPATSRTLKIVLTDGAGEGDFAIQTGAASPFNGIDVGFDSAPAFGDLDGDGDLDLILGAIGGHVDKHENTGTATAPVFTERSGPANPFDGVDIGNLSIPAVSDIDGDGDLDVVLGERDGELSTLKNTGSATAPVFGQAYDDESPLDDFTTGGASYAAPVFADIDGDGDMDLAVGHDGEIRYIEKSPSTQVTINVTGENDLPVAADSAKSTGEGTVLNASVPVATDDDGTIDSYLLVSDVAKGTLTFNDDGSYGFNPNGEFEALSTGDSEEVTFTYKAVDSDGGESGVKTVTITVTGVNDAPAAADQARSTDENTAVSGTVVTGDIDGTVVGHALVSGVAKGSLTFLEDGSWSFDPGGDFDDLDAGESEEVTFTYRALDNDGGQSAVKTVTITVTGVDDASNATPVASNDAKSTDEITVLDAAVPVATDADGTIASYVLDSGVANGALTFNSDGSYSFDPDGQFADLGNGDAEDVTFTYHAVDNDGAASAVKTVTITVTGVNDAPLAADSAKSTGEGSVLNSTVPTATDIDGTIAGYALVSDVAKGALSFNSDGTYSFNPDGKFEALGAGDSEQVTFTYRATDNDGGQSAVKTVTITVTGVNDVPVASDNARSTGEGTVLNAAVPAATDVDGTIASYALVSSVAKGSLTLLADGTYSFDPNGKFEGLGAGESEAVTFTYKAVDNDGGQSAVKTVTITVNGADEQPVDTNSAPVITSPGTYTIVENTTAVGKVTATDSDHDSPLFSIAGGADAFLFQINAATGALSFKAATDHEAPRDADGNNAYEVLVRASDGTASDTEAVTVKVGNEDGVSITGGKKKDVVSDGKTVKGEAMATGEEDTIIGKGKNDKLYGAGGNDLINGGTGNDKLFGDDGDDRLIGGKGNDKLTGGLGEDSFVFDAKLKANIDKVNDFESGVDSIVLDDAVFKKLSPGPLSVEAFVIGKKAKDGDDHVLYNQKNGQLLYDQNGSGGKDALVFAKIGKGLDLDAHDFLVI